MVYYHYSGKWIWKKTSGDSPSPSTFVKKMVEVFDNKMMVINTNSGAIHSLDLTSWTWRRLNLGAIVPFMGRIGMSSWMYNGKMYCFGGQNENNMNYYNELFCYDSSKNSLELTTQGGDIPPPRKHALTIIRDDTVFLCGGLGELGQHCGDLYLFNTMAGKWKQVHGKFLSYEANACASSLTIMSPSHAVLHGLGGTMLLDLQKAKELEEPPTIWDEIPNQFERFHHAAVLEPLSKTIWILGGFDTKTEDFTSEVLKISYKKDSLKDHALDYVTRNISSNDARLCPEEIPMQLKNDIDLHRYKI